MKLTELIDKMTDAKDKGYRWDRNWLVELDYLLLSLWLEMIAAYKKYKRAYHNIESKKLLEYADERKLHTSDLQTVKALNKKYMKEIEKMEEYQDSYKVVTKYYDVFDKYAKALNGNFINDMAMAKRTDTEKNFS